MASSEESEDLLLPVVNFLPLIPDNVSNMKELKKEAFNASVKIGAVRCLAKLCGQVQKIFKRILMNRMHFRKIIQCPLLKTHKLVLLHTSVSSVEQLSDEQNRFIEEHNCKFIIHDLALTYSDFTFDEILRKVFPPDTKDIVTSFETIGHIAHLNLKPSMLPYKKIIGEVLLDKNKHIKTVVNKTDTIDTTYRFFHMELLAGEDRMSATVHEHGCLFEFDYSKVYWNSRLQTEHQRIVDFIQPGDVVFDVFAGVGPFTIPIAKKKCKVYANDLNKASYEALLHNAKLNKVEDNICAYNMEGRKFLEFIVMEEHLCITESGCSGNKTNKHIIMNLPAIAPEFLDVFKEKYSTFDIPLKIRPNIYVHCYCFAKPDKPQEEAEVRISEVLGVDISALVNTRFVRRVAPNKVMMCATFNLLWFEHETEKCHCSSSDNALMDRKRPFEGGVYPMSVTLSKKHQLDDAQ